MDAIYWAVILLFCLGIYTILTYKNLIKIVIGINILESSVILLLINLGYQPEGTAPIMNQDYEVVVDPVPQALALTAIVIGASITALMLFLIVKLYTRYNTLDVREIRRLRG
ncbi:sodium:proton antiporter [Halanaerobaculum tunisiense]